MPIAHIMIHPKVSILIPTYNNAHFLDETISSALNQTFRDFELLIVDNASTDNTKDVVKKYLTDSRIKYFLNETNIGLVNNLNRCLTLASGDYIKYLLSDDKFAPTAVEKMVNAMEAHPTVSLVMAYKYYFGSLNFPVAMPFQGLTKGDEVIYETMRNGYDFIGDATVVMFRRSNLHLGLFRNLSWTCDWEMWIRHLSKGDCYVIPEVLTYIRKHAGQLTNTNNRLFNNRFEEYYLFRRIKDTNEYGLNLSRFDIDRVLKQKAMNCVIHVIYPLLLKRNDPRFKKYYREAMEIARRERVLYSSIFNVVRKTYKYAVRKTSSYYKSLSN